MLTLRLQLFVHWYLLDRLCFCAIRYFQRRVLAPTKNGQDVAAARPRLLICILRELVYLLVVVEELERLAILR